MDSSRWINAGELDIPAVENKGFSGNVLRRKIWEHGENAAEVKPPEMTLIETDDADDRPEAPLPQQLWLIRMNGADRESIRIDGESATLGKSRKADHTISGNPSISRIHVRIYRDGEEYWVEDCGSLNRTFVDDQVVTVPRRLLDGMVLRLADEDFVVRLA